jgi:hypothetical protein
MMAMMTGIMSSIAVLSFWLLVFTGRIHAVCQGALLRFWEAP